MVSVWVCSAVVAMVKKTGWSGYISASVKYTSRANFSSDRMKIRCAVSASVNLPPAPTMTGKLVAAVTRMANTILLVLLMKSLHFSDSEKASRSGRSSFHFRGFSRWAGSTPQDRRCRIPRSAPRFPGHLQPPVNADAPPCTGVRTGPLSGQVPSFNFCSSVPCFYGSDGALPQETAVTFCRVSGRLPPRVGASL